MTPTNSTPSPEPVTETSTEAGGARRSDTANWARPVSSLKASTTTGTTDLVRGRRPMGAIQGFGQLWQKTFRVRLDEAGVTPAEVIRTWRDHFGEFWPANARFHAPLTGIAPGEVALLDGRAPGGLTLSTGVLVLYSDDESFTFMTPEGHMFAGWVTFSAYEDGATTVAQAQVLMRAQDPIIELGMRFGGHRQENQHWETTLRNLAARFGVDAVASTQVVCVDPRRQWRRATNLRYDVGMRSTLHALGRPIRWLRRGR